MADDASRANNQLQQQKRINGGRMVGICCLDKPTGFSVMERCRKVKWLFRGRKAGTPVIWIRLRPAVADLSR